MAVQREHDPIQMDRDTSIHTTVVVPSYNEEDGLPVVLERILAVLDEGAEVLVVDDGSTDRTRAIATQYPCRVVWHKRNQGKGEAVRTGIRYARGENIIFIDADDTYPADLIPEMIELLKTSDMVVGSRSTGHAHIPAFNRVGNAIFRNSIRYFYGFKPYDPLTGFFGIKRELMASLDLKSANFRIESELAIKAASRGVRMADLPIEYGRRLGIAKLRGLQDGYTIFETIVRMLPRHSPAFSLILPGAIVAMIAAVVGALSYGDAGFSYAPEVFLAAVFAALIGLQAVLGGAIAVGHGRGQGILSAGRVARIVGAPAASTGLLAGGVLLIVAAGVWALSSGDNWRTSSDSTSAIENAQLAVAVGVAALELIGASFLLNLLRPSRPSTPYSDPHYAVTIPAGHIEGEERVLGD